MNQVERPILQLPIPVAASRAEWMDRYYKYMYPYGSDKMNFPIKIKKLDTNILELLSRGFECISSEHAVLNDIRLVHVFSSFLSSVKK